MLSGRCREAYSENKFGQLIDVSFRPFSNFNHGQTDRLIDIHPIEMQFYILMAFPGLPYDIQTETKRKMWRPPTSFPPTARTAGAIGPIFGLRLHWLIISDATEFPSGTHKEGLFWVFFLFDQR